jgi:glycosyltransferase involved in cell wall biosynthesis
MKIGIVSFSISKTSGAGRFAINLLRGMQKNGITVSLYTYHIDRDLLGYLSSEGISCFFCKTNLNSIDRYRMISDSRKVLSCISKLINLDEFCDTYIVLSDKIIGMSKFRNNNTWVYISQGDMLFLFFNQTFTSLHFPFSNIFSLQLSRRFAKHQSFSKKYDLILANSNFTSELMSFFFDTNVEGVVYPPVDTERFSPVIDDTTKEKYVLVLLKSSAEPSFRFVEQLARSIKVHVVGEAQINGAINLGNIKDEDLIKEYSNALFTLNPNLQEYFGYSIAESLACGTPVMAFNHGGARDQIVDGFNGWLFTSERGLIEKAKKIYATGYDPSMRYNSRESSYNFTIDASVNKLTTYLATLRMKS